MLLVPPPGVGLTTVTEPAYPPMSPSQTVLPGRVMVRVVASMIVVGKLPFPHLATVPAKKFVPEIASTKGPLWGAVQKLGETPVTVGTG
jgi:hypothetical protein